MDNCFVLKQVKQGQSGHMYKNPDIKKNPWYTLWPLTQFQFYEFILKKKIVRCADCMHSIHGNAYNNEKWRQLVLDWIHVWKYSLCITSHPVDPVHPLPLDFHWSYDLLWPMEHSWPRCSPRLENYVCDWACTLTILPSPWEEHSTLHFSGWGHPSRMRGAWSTASSPTSLHFSAAPLPILQTSEQEVLISVSYWGLSLSVMQRYYDHSWLIHNLNVQKQGI